MTYLTPISSERKGEKNQRQIYTFSPHTPVMPCASRVLKGPQGTYSGHTVGSQGCQGINQTPECSCSEGSFKDLAWHIELEHELHGLSEICYFKF